MQPSIKVAQTLANLLNTSVGYLLGENEEADLFKNPKMLDRLKAINKLTENEKEHIYITIDALIRDFNAKKAYA